MHKLKIVNSQISLRSMVKAKKEKSWNYPTDYERQLTHWGKNNYKNSISQYFSRFCTEINFAYSSVIPFRNENFLECTKNQHSETLRNSETEVRRAQVLVMLPMALKYLNNVPILSTDTCCKLICTIYFLGVICKDLKAKMDVCEKNMHTIIQNPQINY